MNEKTIFIILTIITIGLISITGVLAWDNMQPEDNIVHEIDISNVSTVNHTVDNTVTDSNTKNDSQDDDYAHEDLYDGYYDDYEDYYDDSYYEDYYDY